MEIPAEVIERAAGAQATVFRQTNSRRIAQHSAYEVIAEWTRSTIAAQVRRSCTLDWEMVKKGGDHIVYGVADWIENPPEWVGAAA